MSKDTPKFWKGFGIAIMLYVLVGGCMFIVPIPMIVNGIYEETQGVVEEFEFIKQKDELRKKYTVTLVNPDTQKEKTYYEVYSEGIKKGDHIEIKKYLMTPFPILVKKINGEETEIYKKYSDEFVWDSMLDRILATIVFLLNIFVHIIKYQKRRMNELHNSKRKFILVYMELWMCCI